MSGSRQPEAFENKSIAELFEKLEPKSLGQEEFKKALVSEKEIIGVFGPTGTGKSLFAISYGLSATVRGLYKRMVLSRPIVDVVTGREITLFSDPQAYVKHASDYLRDILAGFADPVALDELMASGKLVLADPHFLRGRTFDESVIIVDDAQGTSAETIVEIITRMGRKSKLIIAGDPVFQRFGDRDGATLAREILLGEESAVVVDLGLRDIVRPGAKKGIKLLLEFQMRKRPLDELESRVRDAARIYAPDADVVTVLNIEGLKKKYEITAQHVPGVLVITKEGHIGRFVGAGGERVQKMEKEVGVSIRAIEHTLDLREIVRAVHPVAWVYKHIVEADFAGNRVRLTVTGDAMGAALGQKGVYIRFLDEVFRKLIGAGIAVVEKREKEEESKEAKAKVRKRRS
ncbi:MAG: PhoH family protein [Acidilobaceae archaeon]